MIVLKAVRISDNTDLYFRDRESYDDYVLTYEEELTEPKFCVDVPFGQTIIDWNEQRSNISPLFSMMGLNSRNISALDISGGEDTENSYKDTDKRLEEYRIMSRTVYDFDNGEATETDYDYKEINLRKSKAITHSTFRNIVTVLEPNIINEVVNVFKNHNLDFDKLEEYFDEELNMDISFWTKKYDSEKQYLQELIDYQKTDDYKRHKNFIDTLEESLAAIRKLDDKNDLANIQINNDDAQVEIAGQNEENKK